MLPADAVAVDHDELAVGGDLEARDPGELLRGDRHRLDGAMALAVPHCLAQHLLLLRRREMAALPLQLGDEPVEDRRLDDQVAVGRAARAVVGRLGQARVARRLLDVRRLVDDHRRVAGADAVRGRAGAVRGAHHRLAARGDDQVRARHQGLRHRDVHPREALQDVGRRAFALQRLAHQAHGLERGLLRAWMRREDHAVARLDPVDRVAGGRQVRVGRRHDAGDDADRLAVLDDALLGDLLDHAHALLAQRVAQHAADLHPLAHAAIRVAEAALLDAHVDETRERRLVRDRPGDGLAEPVDARLVVGLDDRERLARAGEAFVELLLLLVRDAFPGFGGGGHGRPRRRVGRGVGARAFAGETPRESARCVLRTIESPTWPVKGA